MLLPPPLVHRGRREKPLLHTDVREEEEVREWCVCVCVLRDV